MMFSCPKCGDTVKPDSLLRHLREYHLGETDLQVPCPACAKVINTVPAYQKHWYSLHYESKRKKEKHAIHPQDAASSSASVSSECKRARIEPHELHDFTSTSEGVEKPNVVDCVVGTILEAPEAGVVASASDEEVRS